jgi:hypothetical protein
MMCLDTTGRWFLPLRAAALLRRFRKVSFCFGIFVHSFCVLFYYLNNLGASIQQFESAMRSVEDYFGSHRVRFFIASNSPEAKAYLRE